MQETHRFILNRSHTLALAFKDETIVPYTPHKIVSKIPEQNAIEDDLSRLWVQKVSFVLFFVVFFFPENS